MTEVVPAIEEAFRLVGQGRAAVAPRVRLLYPPLPEGSMGEGRIWERDLRATLGAVEGIGYGARLGASRHRSMAGGVMLLLFDWDTLALKALISDHLVHAVRSTAPDGVFAKYLAVQHAHTLGLIGSGRLARWAAEAVCAVRPIQQIRVWSPTQAHRAECVRYLQARSEDGIQVIEVATAEEAIRGAEVVAAATKAAAPVLNGDWLDAGCTIISSTPEELDQGTLRRARIVTTYREGVLTHVPPFRSLEALLQAGELKSDALSVELGDIVAGRANGRRHDQEIIACLNPAYGVLDAVTAECVYQKAVRAGIGIELEP
jgi:ornithine cyclodeaminase/alanine dehydrogenase-like protein (mu-crystallin family)